MTRIPEKFGVEYYRGYLTSQGKRFYDCINRQIEKGDYSGKISFPMTIQDTAAQDAFAAFNALRDDHPEYFYLERQLEFVYVGNIGTLHYPVLYSPDKIMRIQLQLRKAIFQIVRGTEGLSEIDREKIIYERIAQKLSYTNHHDVRDHNVVGPVLLSNGVCEGQNALLILCLRRIGIPSIKVHGENRRGVSHCWALAWIRGVPVHCDVTWDGPVEGVVRFNYFNLSDHKIGADHFSFRGTRTPVSTTDQFSYYRYYGLCVGSFRDLERCIASSDMRRKKGLLLHFDYNPPNNDFGKEIRAALKTNNIRDRVDIYSHKNTNNFAVIKR